MSIEEILKQPEGRRLEFKAELPDILIWLRRLLPLRMMLGENCLLVLVMIHVRSLDSMKISW